jgi:hypothetical protein
LILENRSDGGGRVTLAVPLIKGEK